MSRLRKLLRVVFATVVPSLLDQGMCKAAFIPTAQNFEMKVPWIPKLREEEPISTESLDGIVGLAVDGVIIRNEHFDSDRTRALILRAPTDSFDGCGGHIGSSGEYHYHLPPVCLLSELGIQIRPDGHLFAANNDHRLIGVAMDGFPIMIGLDANATLDRCNGLKSVDGYRYYMRMWPPFFPPCLRGELHPRAITVRNEHNPCARKVFANSTTVIASFQVDGKWVIHSSLGCPLTRSSARSSLPVWLAKAKKKWLSKVAARVKAAGQRRLGNSTCCCSLGTSCCGKASDGSGCSGSCCIAGCGGSGISKSCCGENTAQSCCSTACDSSGCSKSCCNENCGRTCSGGGGGGGCVAGCGCACSACGEAFCEGDCSRGCSAVTCEGAGSVCETSCCTSECCGSIGSCGGCGDNWYTEFSSTTQVLVVVLPLALPLLFVLGGIYVHLEPPHTPAIMAVLVFWLVLMSPGPVFMKAKGLTALESAYWGFQTLFSVGYGDIENDTDELRIFTVFYAGIGVSSVLLIKFTFFGAAWKSAEDTFVRGEENTVGSTSKSSGEVGLIATLSSRLGARKIPLLLMNLFASVISLLLVVGIFSIYWGFRFRDLGCQGHVAVTGVYFTVNSIGTIGFGDLCPTGATDCIVFGLMMVFGVPAWFYCLGMWSYAISSLIVPYISYRPHVQARRARLREMAATISHSIVLSITTGTTSSTDQGSSAAQTRASSAPDAQSDEPSLGTSPSEAYDDGVRRKKESLECPELGTERPGFADKEVRERAMSSTALGSESSCVAGEEALVPKRLENIQASNEQLSDLMQQALQGGATVSEIRMALDSEDMREALQALAVCYEGGISMI